MWLLFCKLAGIEILLSIGPPLVSLHGLSYFVGILLQLSVFMLQILNFVVTMTKWIKTMVFYGLRISNQSAVPHWVEIEDCHLEPGCTDHIYTCLCRLHCKRTQPRRVIFKTRDTIEILIFTVMTVRAVSHNFHSKNRHHSPTQLNSTISQFSFSSISFGLQLHCNNFLYEGIQVPITRLNNSVIQVSQASRFGQDKNWESP
jgi:hypothetical protein